MFEHKDKIANFAWQLVLQLLTSVMVNVVGHFIVEFIEHMIR